MKPTVKAALIFVAIYVAIKIVLFQSNLQHDDNWSMLGIFANMLFILLASFLGMVWHKRSEQNMESIFLSDMKIAMQGAMTYALLIGLFTYSYYSFIDTGHMDVRIDKIMTGFEDFDASTLTPEQNPTGLTTEQWIQKERDAAKDFYSPWLQSAITTLGLFVLGMIYALIITILYRRVFSKMQS